MKLPEGIRATILAEPGFGDQARYAQLRDLEASFVIRFREGITLTDELGRQQRSGERVARENGPGNDVEGRRGPT